MEVQHDIALREFNTLALNARAGTLYRVASETELDTLVAQLGDSARELRVLGQGSNTVFTRDIDEPLLQLLLSDIVVSELDTPGDTAGDADRTDAGVLVDVGGGLPWQALVDWSCERQLAGLENLNRIPGSVGAAPVQNIGAYGVELGQRLVSVRGFDLQDRCWRELSNDACELGYRDSIFKHALRDRFVITRVRLRLDRSFFPVLDYPALASHFAGQPAPDLRAVAAAVAAIRASKLPDPALLPNAGSFFKNPVVERAHYQRLQAAHADIPGYVQRGGEAIKIPAAWLLERAGWKGRRAGALGMHQHQALVMVNYGGASGLEVLAFAQAMQADIRQRFGIDLDIEPRVY